MHDISFYAEQLTDRDMENALSFFDELISIAQNQTEDLKLEQNQLSELISALLSGTNEAAEIDLKKAIIRLISASYYNFMRHRAELYNEASRLFGFVHEGYELKQAVSACFLGETRFISAYTRDQSLYIRIPQVPAKYYRRSDIFNEELRLVLGNLFKSNPIYIKKKTIQIVHVFNTDFTGLVPDNDNYDFKSIIDIITDHVSGGDSGINCWIHLMSVTSDRVAQGSYIIVSPQDNVNLTNTVNELASVFEVQKE